MLWSQPYSPIRPDQSALGGEGFASACPIERDAVDRDRAVAVAGDHDRAEAERVVGHEGVSPGPGAEREPGAAGRAQEEEPVVPRDQLDGGFPLLRDVTRLEAAGEAGRQGLGRLDRRRGLALLRGEHHPEGGVGDPRGAGVGAVLGDDDGDPEPVVRQGGELGGEPVDRAVVADLAMAVELGEDEPEPEAPRRLLPLPGELRRPHRLQGLGLHDRPAGSPPLVEQGGEELPEVEHGAIQVAGRGVAERERRRVEGPAVVGPHLARRQVLLASRATARRPSTPARAA